MQRPVYLCRPPHGTTPINTYILSSGMSGTIWYLQSLSLRKNLAGNACVDFSIWFPRPDPRRGRLEAARLVGRIIPDPPIQRLKPKSLYRPRRCRPYLNFQLHIIKIRNSKFRITPFASLPRTYPDRRRGPPRILCRLLLRVIRTPDQRPTFTNSKT